MDFQDYAPGTSFLRLLQSDFKNVYRFQQYARFMQQEGAQQIIVPIDFERAVQEARRADDVWRSGKAAEGRS